MHKHEDEHPDDVGVELALPVTPSQLMELHALGYRGPTPSTFPQADALLRQWRRSAPACHHNWIRVPAGRLCAWCNRTVPVVADGHVPPIDQAAPVAGPVPVLLTPDEIIPGDQWEQLKLVVTRDPATWTDAERAEVKFFEDNDLRSRTIRARAIDRLTPLNGQGNAESLPAERKD